MDVSIWVDFIQSDEWGQFCQWKCVELSTTIGIDAFTNFAHVGASSWGEVYRGTKRDSNKHYAIKPVSLSNKNVTREELDVYNSVVKLLGASTEPSSKFIIQTLYMFNSGLNVVFGMGSLSSFISYSRITVRLLSVFN